MVYTLAQRTEIVILYGKFNENARQTAAEFNRRHPENSLNHKYVLELIRKFFETGSVNNKKRDGKRVINDLTQIEVLGHVAAAPQSSVRELSTLTNISVGSVHKVLRLNKFHPYKMQPIHELTEDDFDRRIEFCEIITDKINRNEISVKNICFSDECTFYMNGFVNRQNCRYWDTENPHLCREVHTQYPEKLNVWAGILGNSVIGPLFIEENLTGPLYLNLLQNYINPIIVESLENQQDEHENQLIDENGLFFQQDGAPPHYTLSVREWLDATYPGQWIGRRGPIEWPARSPDLSPIDFFLWGYLKSIVYKTQPENIHDLRNRITIACQNIRRENFQNVREEFENRLYYCLDRNGEQFEHLK